MRINKWEFELLLDKILWGGKNSLTQFPSLFFGFQKRKAEAEPSEKEGEDKVSDEAPKEGDEELKKEEAVQSTTAEEKKKEGEATQRETQAKRPKAANPYGVWEQILEEEDP